jgi:ribulose-phosphate 3-epimerase
MPLLPVIERLREQAPVILPSLLQCDFGNLEREVAQLSAAGAQAMHLDVMDGHFVPNLTYGMPIVAAVRRLTDLPIDVHLMISQPHRYLEQFARAGADIITVHAEACADLAGVLRQIRRLGCAAGIAINPPMPVEDIVDCLEYCDLVLPMSVEAGFGGQAFDPIALDKLREIRRMAPHVLLEVDGGINPDTIGQCAEAGAECYVVGSAIFNSQQYDPVISELASLAIIG